MTDTQESAGHSAGTYICIVCTLPLHLYASASGAQDQEALTLLGWTYQQHQGWRCQDCAVPRTQQEGDH